MAYDPMHLICPSFNLSAAKSTASASYSVKLRSVTTMSIKLTLFPGHVVHHHPRSALPPRAADPLAHRQQHHHGHRGHRHGAAFACWVTSFSTHSQVSHSFPSFPGVCGSSSSAQEGTRSASVRTPALELVGSRSKTAHAATAPRSRGDALGRAAPGFS